MIKAEINFTTKRPKQEVLGIFQISIEHGEVQIKYYGDDGVRSWFFDYGEIDYIRLGNQ